MIWKATSESGALRHLALVWAALTTTLVFGVLTVRASAPAGAELRLIGLDILGVPSSEESVPAGPTTSIVSDLIPPIAAPPADSAESDGGATVANGPSILYAGVEWSLQEARFVSVSESSDGFPVVIAELDLSNTLETQNLRVRRSDLALIWSDGQRFEVDRFDQVAGSGSFSLEPGEQRSVTAVFKPRLLVDPVAEETVLEIGDPGRIPAQIPLVGPVPASVFPIVAPIVGDPTVVDDPDRATGQLVIRPKRAVLGLNAGPYRAADGTRLVLVEVLVQRALPRDDSTFMQPDFWQLDVDGVQNGPSRVYRQATDRTSEDLVTLVFVVNDDFDQLNLEVAVSSTGRHEYRLELDQVG